MSSAHWGDMVMSERQRCKRPPPTTPSSQRTTLLPRVSLSQPVGCFFSQPHSGAFRLLIIKPGAAPALLWPPTRPLNRVAAEVRGLWFWDAPLLLFFLYSVLVAFFLSLPEKVRECAVKASQSQHGEEILLLPYLHKLANLEPGTFR